ncbi:peptidoglycan DD-metalloendopeptidase family protein [Helicobacter vulpis]|uniref:peptidoglycan DD-metalloendopeptidase family protein n=1 Tax=Helicobacter vulpis TaxID=2316076 RepID=UPI000EADC14E|nr:peptidoglycan DD-metalloendopeptidase family protein [Helicobacter vulpis]
MIRLIGLWVACLACGYGAVGERLVWDKGATLLGFLDKNKIDPKVYYDLAIQDKELGAEIRAGVSYYTLRDDQGVLLQALIPVSEAVQLRIFKQADRYHIDFIPIVFSSVQKTLSLRVQKSPYKDILRTTGDARLAQEFVDIYKKTVNFRRAVIKGDQLIVIYTRKHRLDRPFGFPSIQASMLETARRPHYVFAYEGKYYDAQGKEMMEFFLETPVRYSRVSSKFSHGRMHPILKEMRPHYGVDLAAKFGAAVHAATEGNVVFMGYKGGYGRTVEIKYGKELRLLYAHLSAFAPGLKVHSYVRRGQLIGRVGSTGLSTGPHLHFGVYKNDRPIDPLGRIRTAKNQLNGREKEHFERYIRPYQHAIKDMQSFEYAQQETLKITY